MIVALISLFIKESYSYLVNACSLLLIKVQALMSQYEVSWRQPSLFLKRTPLSELIAFNVMTTPGHDHTHISTHRDHSSVAPTTTQSAPPTVAPCSILASSTETNCCAQTVPLRQLSDYRSLAPGTSGWLVLCPECPLRFRLEDFCFELSDVPFH